MLTPAKLINWDAVYSLRACLHVLRKTSVMELLSGLLLLEMETVELIGDDGRWTLPRPWLCFPLNPTQCQTVPLVGELAQRQPVCSCLHNLFRATEPWDVGFSGQVHIQTSLSLISQGHFTSSSEYSSEISQVLWRIYCFTAHATCTEINETTYYLIIVIIVFT